MANDPEPFSVAAWLFARAQEAPTWAGIAALTIVVPHFSGDQFDTILRVATTVSGILAIVIKDGGK
jgi:hypothetical protein